MRRSRLWKGNRNFMKYLNENPANCEKWLTMAKDDLRLAQDAVNNRYELLCYHCQQASEKALKAVLIQQSGKYPKTHSMDELICEIESMPCSIPDTIKDAARMSSPYRRKSMFPFKFPFHLSPSVSVSLTDHAEKTRYPGEYLPLDEQAYTHAIQKAIIIVEWAENQIKK